MSHRDVIVSKIPPSPLPSPTEGEDLMKFPLPCREGIKGRVIFMFFWGFPLARRPLVKIKKDSEQAGMTKLQIHKSEAGPIFLLLLLSFCSIISFNQDLFIKLFSSHSGHWATKTWAASWVP